MSKIKVKIQYIGGDSRKSEFVSLVARNIFLRKLLNKHRDDVLSGETINIDLDKGSILRLIDTGGDYLKIEYEAFEEKDEKNSDWQNQSEASGQIENINTQDSTEGYKFGTQSEGMKLSGYIRNRMNKIALVLIVLCAFSLGVAATLLIRDYSPSIWKKEDDKLQNNSQEKIIQDQEQQKEKLYLKRSETFGVLKDKFEKFGSYYSRYAGDTNSVYEFHFFPDTCILFYSLKIVSHNGGHFTHGGEVEMSLLDPDSIHYSFTESLIHPFIRGNHIEIFCKDRKPCPLFQVKPGIEISSDHIQLPFLDNSSDSERQVQIVKEAFSKLISLCQSN